MPRQLASVTTGDAGSYDVVVSNGCGSVESNAAVLTVERATPTLTWGAPAAIEYGTPLGATQLNASASAPGTMVYTPAAGAVLGAGNGQVLSVTFTPNDTANYTTVNKTVTIDVTRRALTVTADPQSKIYGEVDPPLTYQLTAGSLVTGDTLIGALTRQAGETVGDHPILQGTLTAGPNYQLTFAGASLTIRAWFLTGFYQPVAMPASNGLLVYNTVKGGSTVPFTFNVYRAHAGAEIKDLTTATPFFTVKRIGCAANALEDPVDVEFTITGATSLRYDVTAGQFIQNWQTAKGAGVCHAVTMTTADGSTLSAYFKTK